MILLILLGAPGVGKGAQAKLISQNYNLGTLSTGELLRSAVQKKSKLGLKIQKIIDSGSLVPDDIVSNLVQEVLSKKHVDKRGYILDGFPRTTAQAKYLDEIILKLGIDSPYIVSLQLDEKLIVKRLLSRIYCKKCNSCYNLITLPTKLPGVCDNCGSKEFFNRADDNEDAIKVRIKAYNNQTAPLISYYENSPKYVSVDANMSADEVYGKISEKLNF